MIIKLADRAESTSRKASHGKIYSVSKRFFSLFILVLLSLGLFIIAPTQGFAAENYSNDTTGRLNSLVNKYSINTLNENDTKQVADNCVNLQTQIAQNQFAISSQIRQRITIYTDLQNEIKALELRMMRQGIDASELDLLIGKIQEKQDELILTADKLGTVGDDIRIIDCRSRPEQFKAGAKEYKQLQQKLIVSAKEARQLIVNSPQSTFDPLKDRLSL